jgi:hypothetical protein
MGLIGLAVVTVLGGMIFGRDLVSYVRSSTRTVQSAIKDAVPLEFEFKRARDLLEEIIPEMHANIRLIAEEEVEVARLETEIQQGEERLSEQRKRVRRLREELDQERDRYRLGGSTYSRDEVSAELARSFGRYKEAELGQKSKQRLLASRQQSLRAAMSLLDSIRTRKQALEDKVQTLEGQYRLVKATAVGSRIQVDNSKLAQTERLLSQIKKRLDVAERVLAHESRFAEEIEVDTVSEGELLSLVDEYFDGREAGRPATSAVVSDPAS